MASRSTPASLPQGCCSASRKMRRIPGMDGKASGEAKLREFIRKAQEQVSYHLIYSLLCLKSDVSPTQVQVHRKCGAYWAFTQTMSESRVQGHSKAPSSLAWLSAQKLPSWLKEHTGA